MEIDIHGLSSEDAIYEVEAFIEKAYLSKVKKIKIITGKGKNILNRAVLNYLKEHPSVESSRLGYAYEGSWGAVIAYII